MSPCIFPKRDGSTDPVAHAIAETLFWAEQMKEHAAFFIMLMPGDALAGPRGQAGKFQAEFAAIGEQARTWTKEGLAVASRSTIENRTGRISGVAVAILVPTTGITTELAPPTTSA